MVFIQKMKGMNDVPVLGQSFNNWFPLTITVYCAMLFFNLWEKCASRLFISSRFRFDTVRSRAVARALPLPLRPPARTNIPSHR